MSERRHKITRIIASLAHTLPFAGEWTLPVLILLRTTGRQGRLGTGWQAAPTVPAPFTRTVGKGERCREVDASYPNRAQRRGSASGQRLSPVAPGAHGHHR